MIKWIIKNNQKIGIVIGGSIIIIGLFSVAVYLAYNI